MQKEKKYQSDIKVNFLMNCVLTLSSFLFPLVSFRYVSRILLPEGTGKVSLAVAVVSYFTMFSQLGIPTYGIRACATVRDDREKLTRTAHELLIWNLILSVVAYVALFLAIVIIPKFQQERTLYLICSVSILMNALGMEWLYKGLELYTFITIRSILIKALSIVAIFLLIHEQQDYVIYGAIFTGASCANYLFNLLRVHRYIELTPVKSYDLRRHLRPLLVFFAMSCAVTVYTNLDMVMLGFMTNDAEVGNYHAGVMVKNILVAAVTSLAAVLLPRASYYVEKGQMEDFREISRKALNFAILLAMPLAVFFAMFADKCIYFLAGSAFEGAILPLRILMPAIVMIAVSNLTGIQMLVPLGQERVVLNSEIAGVITDLILNALLIPRYGATGAAFGTMTAEIVVLAVQCRSLAGELNYYLGDVAWWKVLVGCVAAAIGASLACYLPVGDFGIIFCGGCLFFSVYLLLLLVLHEKMTIVVYNTLKNRLSSVK